VHHRRQESPLVEDVAVPVVEDTWQDDMLDSDTEATVQALQRAMNPESAQEEPTSTVEDTAREVQEEEAPSTEYEVEKVVGTRITPGGKHNQFLVKFQGYVHPEWVVWHSLVETAWKKTFFVDIHEKLLEYVIENPGECLVGPLLSCMKKGIRNVKTLSGALAFAVDMASSKQKR
jgi:hypothetical protein